MSVTEWFDMTSVVSNESELQVVVTMGQLESFNGSTHSSSMRINVTLFETRTVHHYSSRLQLLLSACVQPTATEALHPMIRSRDTDSYIRLRKLLGWVVVVHRLPFQGAGCHRLTACRRLTCELATRHLIPACQSRSIWRQWWRHTCQSVEDAGVLRERPVRVACPIPANKQRYTVTQSLISIDVRLRDVHYNDNHVLVVCTTTAYMLADNNDIRIKYRCQQTTYLLRKEQ